MKPNRNFLERRLTVRMSILQALVMLFFFCAVVFPLSIYPILHYLGDTRPLDVTVTEVFAAAIVVDENGKPAFQASPEIDKLAAENPAIWFAAYFDSGTSVHFGEMPDEYQAGIESLYLVRELNLTPRYPDSRYMVTVRQEQTAAGQATIATGGGPRVGASQIIRIFSIVLVMATVLLVVVVCAIAIPFFIRRELRGLKQAANLAAQIDIDRRGVRLPEADVPEEILALVRAVNGALARLDKAYEQRSRFLATSAHELRTPIAILQTRIETAQPFPEQSKLLLDVARLGSLAGQLLDLQRLEFGEVVFESLDLVELANEVVADLAPLAIRRGSTLSIEPGPQKVMVRGDETSLKRALTNLVQNAISHGGAHGNITLHITSDGQVSVSDDGPGIPREDRDRIFEPFYRSRPSSQGGGLGLNLVELIVKSHGGDISVTESASGGARFTLSLRTERNAGTIKQS